MVRNELLGTAAVSLRDLGGNPVRHYLYSGGSWSWLGDDIFLGRQRIAQVTSSGTRYFHGDHLGSVRRVSTGAGASEKAYDFFPYGLPVKETVGQERLWFGGYELEHQNTSDYTDDLYFLHARWYFPYMGRFLSADPLRGDPAHPQSLNLYAYVTDNPLNFVDPWGLAAQQSQERPIRIAAEDGVCDVTNPTDPDCHTGGTAEVIGRAPGGASVDLGAYSSTQDLKNSYAWLAMQNRAAFSGSTITAHGFWRYAVRNATEDPMLQVLASITGVILPSERPLVEEFDAAYENWFANPQLGLGEDSRYGRLWGPLGNAVWFVTLGQSGSSCVGWATGLYSALAPLASDRARPVLAEHRLLSFIPIHTFVTLELRRGAGWVTVRRYDPFWRLR